MNYYRIKVCLWNESIYTGPPHEEHFVYKRATQTFGSCAVVRGSTNLRASSRDYGVVHSVLGTIGFRVAQDNDRHIPICDYKQESIQ